MKRSFQKPVMRGKHCINLYVDFDQEDAGCFVTGHYDVHKSMLIAAAMENPSFGRAFLDAALDYANWLNQTEIGAPTSFVSERGERRQQAPNDAGRQSSRPACRTREKGGNHE